MDTLVIPRERALGNITLVLGSIVWLGIMVGTVGFALLGLAFGFLVYVFAQSAFIAHIRGNGVRLSNRQHPELFDQFTQCCERLAIDKAPEVYVLAGNGALNAFAAKFFSTQYVVLLSDVIDAMEQHPDGVRFYMGHELGHLRRQHLNWQVLRWPVLWLPLLGAAYARARETTCDRHGRACCATEVGAAHALAALAAGSRRWKDLNLEAYYQQARKGTGFWMSFHELTAAYPWMTKRVARVVNPDVELPPRPALSYVLAAFVPFAGRMGAGFGVVIMVYIIAMLAAIALPAYQDYSARAGFTRAMEISAPARATLARHFEITKDIPESLAAIGIADQPAANTRLELNAQNMVLTVTTPHGSLRYTPLTNDHGKVDWVCEAGQDTKLGRIPKSCN